MTQTPAYCLDWRTQFAELAPYFHGRGGVVHIHAGPESPISAFIRVVRYKLDSEEWPFKWSTVAIDWSNASTHYITDIILQIWKSVGLKITPDTGHPVNIEVGNENDAGGSVVLSNVNIDVVFDSFGRPIRESELIRKLCASLEAELERRRVALIFVDTHKSDPGNLTNLGRKLWEGGLEHLISKGLLIIDVFDPTHLDGSIYAWPPTPDSVVLLPDRYDSQSRSDALEDLASIILSKGWYPTRAEAAAFAAGVINPLDYVRKVHARFARHLITGVEASTDA